MEKMNFAGLYKGQKPSSEKFFFCESIVERSLLFNWDIFPHFHSHLYQIFIIKNGSAKTFLNSKEYHLSGPTLLFIPPNHIHGLKYSEDVEGGVITFSRYYTKSLFRDFPELENEFNEPVFITHQKDTAPTEEYQKIYHSIDLIQHEYASVSKHKEAFLFLQIATLFIQVIRLEIGKYKIAPVENLGELDTFKRFISLIKKADSPFKPLSEYAEELGISLSGLNRICHNIDGISPLQIIQNEIITNSKALLYNRKYNIEEVAFQLGFQDPSYFTRFFKKKTGVTPKQYRERLEG